MSDPDVILRQIAKDNVRQQVPNMRVACQHRDRRGNPTCQGVPVHSRDGIHFCRVHDPGPGWTREGNP